MKRIIRLPHTFLNPNSAVILPQRIEWWDPDKKDHVWMPNEDIEDNCWQAYFVTGYKRDGSELPCAVGVTRWRLDLDIQSEDWQRDFYSWLELEMPYDLKLDRHLMLAQWVDAFYIDHIMPKHEGEREFYDCLRRAEMEIRIRINPYIVLTTDDGDGVDPILWDGVSRRIYCRFKERKNGTVIMVDPLEGRPFARVTPTDFYWID